MTAALKFAAPSSDASPSFSLPQLTQLLAAPPESSFSEICAALLPSPKKEPSKSVEIEGEESGGAKTTAKNSKQPPNPGDIGTTFSIQLAVASSLPTPLPLPSTASSPAPPDNAHDVSLSKPGCSLGSLPDSNLAVRSRVSSNESAEKPTSLQSSSTYLNGRIEDEKQSEMECNDIKQNAQREVCNTDFDQAISQTEIARAPDIADIQKDSLEIDPAPKDDQPGATTNGQTPSTKEVQTNFISAERMKQAGSWSETASAQSASRAESDDGAGQITQYQTTGLIDQDWQAPKSGRSISIAGDSQSAFSFQPAMPTARDQMSRLPSLKTSVDAPKLADTPAIHTFTTSPLPAPSLVPPTASLDSSFPAAHIHLRQLEDLGTPTRGEKKLHMPSVSYADDQSQDSNTVAPEPLPPNKPTASSPAELGHSKTEKADTSDTKTPKEKDEPVPDTRTKIDIGQDGSLTASVSSACPSGLSAARALSGGEETSVPDSAKVTYQYPLESARSAAPLVSQAPLARLLTRTSETEMRIGLNTPAFGSIEVRTIVHATDVGVQIGSEKGDLRSMIASELPNLAHSLEQQNLRLSHVEFHGAGSSTSHDSGFGGNSHTRHFSAQTDTAVDFASDFLSDDLPQDSEPQYSREGLSVLA